METGIHKRRIVRTTCTVSLVCQEGHGERGFGHTPVRDRSVGMVNTGAWALLSHSLAHASDCEHVAYRGQTTPQVYVSDRASRESERERLHKYIDICTRVIHSRAPTVLPKTPKRGATLTRTVHSDITPLKCGSSSSGRQAWNGVRPAGDHTPLVCSHNKECKDIVLKSHFARLQSQRVLAHKARSSNTASVCITFHEKFAHAKNYTTPSSPRENTQPQVSPAATHCRRRASTLQIRDRRPCAGQ